MSITWVATKLKVDPELASDISELLGGSEFSWEVYRGWASREVQTELYKRWLGGGPLAAKPGHSAHECDDPQGNPCSLAVDVARLDSKGGLHWDYADHTAWEWLWAACLKHPRLHSGHLFSIDSHGRVSRDDDHIQAVKWQKYKADLLIAGKW